VCRTPQPCFHLSLPPSHPYIIIILLNKTNYNIRFALRNRRLLNQWQAALECVRAMRFAECLRNSIVAAFLRFLFKVARQLWNQYSPDAVWPPSFMNTPKVNLNHLLNLSAFAQLAHFSIDCFFRPPPCRWPPGFWWSRSPTTRPRWSSCRLWYANSQKINLKNFVTCTVAAGARLWQTHATGRPFQAPCTRREEAAVLRVLYEFAAFRDTPELGGKHFDIQREELFYQVEFDRLFGNLKPSSSHAN